LPAEYLFAQLVALQGVDSALVLSKKKQRGFHSVTNFSILCFPAKVLFHWISNDTVSVRDNSPRMWAGLRQVQSADL